MKFFVTVLLLAAAAYGQLPVARWTTGLNQPAYAVLDAAWPQRYAAAWRTAAPFVTASQYHAQDEMGRASFGYSHPGHSADHYRDAAGNQVGRWAYISPEGKQLRFNYVADSNGFQVATNAVPSVTAEVAAAERRHAAAWNAAAAQTNQVAAVRYV